VGATLRAAATSRAATVRERAGKWPSPPNAPAIKSDDLRVKIRTRPRSPLIVIVVDCSESMQALARMSTAWHVALRLLARAYLTRDRVAVIAFGGEDAWTVTPPTSSVMLARDSMRRLKVGGATPLAAGLQLAQRTILNDRARDSGSQAVMVLISDGDANVPLRAGPWVQQEIAEQASKLKKLGVKSLVVDANPRQEPSALMRQLAGWLG